MYVDSVYDFEHQEELISRVDARKNRLLQFREFSYDISHVA